MDNVKENQKGFSMIEIVIAIALIGIMSAALAPSFMDITRKTKLKADIQSVETFQNMIEIYSADHDGKLPGNQTESKVPIEVEASVYKALFDGGYIGIKDLEGETGTLKLQTDEASLKYDGAKEQVVLSINYDKNEKVVRLARDLSDREEEWIILPNGVSTPKKD
ncbi:MAG: type II secretion system protein [Cellulosilyticaceae bacterium]